MAQDWRMVRVPEELARRLDRAVEATQRAYSEGRISLPNEIVEAVPIWWVIQAAIDEVEARRRRSRRSRGRRALASGVAVAGRSPAGTAHRTSEAGERS